MFEYANIVGVEVRASTDSTAATVGCELDDAKRGLCYGSLGYVEVDYRVGRGPVARHLVVDRLRDMHRADPPHRTVFPSQTADLVRGEKLPRKQSPTPIRSPYSGINLLVLVYRAGLNENP
ncbi:MAG: hypothetical protein IPL39_13340 [Opitutaceae bacterium]|nr:hypothetical protein [Opitutaceae bacterium]